MSFYTEVLFVLPVENKLVACEFVVNFKVNLDMGYPRISVTLIDLERVGGKAINTYSMRFIQSALNALNWPDLEAELLHKYEQGDYKNV